MLLLVKNLKRPSVVVCSARSRSTYEYHATKERTHEHSAADRGWPSTFAYPPREHRITVSLVAISYIHDRLSRRWIVAAVGDRYPAHFVLLHSYLYRGHCFVSRFRRCERPKSAPDSHVARPKTLEELTLGGRPPAAEAPLPQDC
jgi:hypothetical protein